MASIIRSTTCATASRSSSTAYDGTVDFYIIDDVDPIAKVWQSAFPGLFKTKDQMPAGLDAHLRYPEELFRVQTAAYSKYRLSPDAFFGRTGAWSVAQAPIARPRAGVIAAASPQRRAPTTRRLRQQDDLATESGTERFVPYYSMLRSPGETEASFKLLRPFVPFSTDDSKRNLQAFMTASSDPQDYGSLVAYEVTSAEDGPFTVSNTMNTESSVSQQLSLLNIEGTDVVFGDLQMVPLAGGLLWVRPVYVQPTVVDQRVSQPTIELVLVSQNKNAAFGSSLSSALAKLFPGFDEDIGDVVGDTPGNGVDEPGDGSATPPPTDQTPADLLDQAESLFAASRPSTPEPGSGHLPGQGRGSPCPGAASPVSARTGLVQLLSALRRSAALVGERSGRRACSSTQLNAFLGAQIAPRSTSTSARPIWVPFDVHRPVQRSVAPVHDVGREECRASRPCGRAQLLGQRGEILAERDLVAGLLVGQLHLAAAQRVDDLVADNTLGNLGHTLPEAIDVAAELAELVGQLDADVGQPLVEQRHVLANCACLGVAGARCVRGAVPSAPASPRWRAVARRSLVAAGGCRRRRH